MFLRNISPISALVGSISLFPVKKSTTSCIESIPSTSIPSTTEASFAFFLGTITPFSLFFFAQSADEITPLTGLTFPSRDSSPIIRKFFSNSDLISPEAASIPIDIGRSKYEPCFFMSAGARFTVILLWGKSYLQFFIADLTRSLLSLTAASGRPTVVTFEIV